MSDQNQRQKDNSNVQPTTSKSSSKTQLDEDDEPLDLSTKRMRGNHHCIVNGVDIMEPVKVRPPILWEEKSVFKAPFGAMPWGCLQFFQGNNHVLSHDLWNYDPIVISAETLLTLKPVQQDDAGTFLERYSDWEHVIGKGFILKRQTGDLSVVQMQRLDNDANCDQYKIYAGEDDINIMREDVYEIYNGNKIFKNLNRVKDMKSAYEFSKSCYAMIAICGEYMRVIPFFTINHVRRDNMASYPYWFRLKLNPEYVLLNKHVKNIMKNKI